MSTADRAMKELFTGAFFFAMGSYEYLKYQAQERQKSSTIITPTFLKALPHTSKHIQFANTVSITFKE
jgi:hypothetical protein